MKRGWKILIVVLAVLAALVVLNALALDSETKPAEVTVAGGQILTLGGGELQVLDTPATEPVPRETEAPIVLLHCYTCAIDWWDQVTPILARTHRVISIDLLGHGGSEKPSSGYSVENQASLVAEALGQLDVKDAVVVGHSLGGAVATSLAENSPELVNRIAILDTIPDMSFGHLDRLSQLSRVPGIGQAIWRLAPDFMLKKGMGQSFAPGFDVPDRFVTDLKRMTYSSYEQSPTAFEDFVNAEPLTDRISPLNIPLLVIFGDDDQIGDARASLSAYAGVPGSETKLIHGVGHSPNVEAPGQTADLILAFAPPPTHQTVGSKANPKSKSKAREKGKNSKPKGDAKNPKSSGAGPARPDKGSGKSKSGKSKASKNKAGQKSQKQPAGTGNP